MRCALLSWVAATGTLQHFYWADSKNVFAELVLRDEANRNTSGAFRGLP